jgi:glyoxylase-like metal-dependent hydrolase (beta-lactamase superfamily II)
MLKIQTVIVGALEVNCYIVYDSETKEALVIDPGDEADRIIKAVKSLGVSPKGILLTHAHVDHIRGVGAVSASEEASSVVSGSETAVISLSVEFPQAARLITSIARTSRTAIVFFMVCALLFSLLPSV